MIGFDIGLGSKIKVSEARLTMNIPIPMPEPVEKSVPRGGCKLIQRPNQSGLVDHPRSRKSSHVASDLHIAGFEPTLALLPMLRPVEGRGIRVDHFGLVKEGGITAIGARPASRVGRENEISGPPEIKCAPGVPENASSRFNAKQSGNAVVNTAERGLENPPVISTYCLAFVGQKVAHTVNDPEAGLEGVDLPVDKIPEPLCRSSLRPANGYPGSKAMDPKWSRARVCPFRGADSLNDFRDLLEVRLGDCDDETSVGQGQVDRHEAERSKPRLSGITTGAANQDQTDT